MKLIRFNKIYVIPQKENDTLSYGLHDSTLSVCKMIIVDVYVGGSGHLMHTSPFFLIFIS